MYSLEATIEIKYRDDHVVYPLPTVVGTTKEHLYLGGNYLKEVTNLSIHA